MMMCSPEIPNMQSLYRVTLTLSILWAFGFTGNLSALADPIRPKADDAYQAITGDSNEEDRSRWDTFFSTNDYVYGKEPAAFLKANIGILPLGRALEIGRAHV